MQRADDRNVKGADPTEASDNHRTVFSCSNRIITQIHQRNAAEINEPSERRHALSFRKKSLRCRDKIVDDLSEFFPVRFLNEVTCTFDGGVRLSLRSGNKCLKYFVSSSRDRIFVAERG